MTTAGMLSSSASAAGAASASAAGAASTSAIGMVAVLGTTATPLLSKLISAARRSAQACSPKARARRPRLPNHRGRKTTNTQRVCIEFVLGEMGLHVDPAARTSMSCDTGRRGRGISTREKLYSTYEKAIFGVENAVEKNWCIAPIQQLYNRQALRHGPVSIQHLYSTVECCIAIQLYSSSTVYTLYTTPLLPGWWFP